MTTSMAPETYDDWRQELRAAHAARNSIGPEYEAVLAEVFAERALQHFTAGLRDVAPAQRSPSPVQRLVLALASVAAIVPMTGLLLVMAVMAAHVSVLLAALLLFAGMLCCCATLVLVNVHYAGGPRRAHSPRHRA